MNDKFWLMTTRTKFWTWSPSRGDYLTIRVALLLAPVLYALYTLLPPITDWLAGRPLQWAALSEAQAPAPIATTGGAGVEFAGDVIWTIPGAGVGQRLLALGPGVEVTLLIALGSVCLWRLVTRIRTGDAFGGPAVAYVRALAVLVLSYGILVKATRVLVDFLVTAPARQDPAAFFTLTPGSLLALALGLLLLALAEGFRQGRRLRADVAGLV